MSQNNFQKVILLIFLILLLEKTPSIETVEFKQNNIHSTSDGHIARDIHNQNNQHISSGRNNDISNNFSNLIDDYISTENSKKHYTISYHVDPSANVNYRNNNENNRINNYDVDITSNAGRNDNKTENTVNKRVKERLNNRRRKTLRTSCGFSLCTYSRNYPYRRINDVVNEVRIILTSHNAFIAKEIDRIDKNVLNYSVFYKNHSAKIQEYDKDGCTFHVNVTHPLEGIAVNERKAYYIVNIPSFQQPVPLIKCNSENECNGINPSLTKCQQIYRKEELLVLPLKRREFDISDFRIKHFSVPDGCQCGAFSSNI